MPNRFEPLLAVVTLSLVACGGTSADIRQTIAAFHKDADAGRFTDIRRYHTFGVTDWENYMGRRAELGRMVRTTEAKVESAYQTTVVHHNTEFERGRALEVFFFKTDDTGTRLQVYNYSVGKRIWCPVIAVTSGCSIEDVPVSATSVSR